MIAYRSDCEKVSEYTQSKYANAIIPIPHAPVRGDRHTLNDAATVRRARCGGGRPGGGGSLVRRCAGD